MAPRGGSVCCIIRSSSRRSFVIEELFVYFFDVSVRVSVSVSQRIGCVESCLSGFSPFLFLISFSFLVPCTTVCIAQLQTLNPTRTGLKPQTEIYLETEKPQHFVAKTEKPHTINVSMTIITSSEWYNKKIATC